MCSGFYNLPPISSYSMHFACNRAGKYRSYILTKPNIPVPASALTCASPDRIVRHRMVNLVSQEPLLFNLVPFAHANSVSQIVGRADIREQIDTDEKWSTARYRYSLVDQ